jgi:hypothetical protein
VLFLLKLLLMIYLPTLLRLLYMVMLLLNTLLLLLLNTLLLLPWLLYVLITVRPLPQLLHRCQFSARQPLLP